MDVSIIIVNYNVKEFLRGAIASAKRSLAAGGLSGELIVVDNASKDGSAAFIEANFPDVRLFALEENIGFGRANNLGMRNAMGRHFLLLNPDTILSEDTLRTMTAFAESHPLAGLLGCKLLNADGSFQLPCRRGFPTPWASFTKLFGLAALFPGSKLFSQYNLTYLPIDEVAEVDAISGAFMFLPRRIFEQTGGFDESFFMYGEDLDLCFRTKKAGHKIYYVPTTATVHFKGESTRRSELNEVKMFYEAMHVFVKKNFGASFVFTILLRIGISLRSMFALAKKHRGAMAQIVFDFCASLLAVLFASKLLLSDWFGLPPIDYPLALLVPPLIVVGVLAALRAYSAEDQRKLRKLFLGVPLAIIVLSSLTYFFKHFASSRSLLLSFAGILFALLGALRIARRLIDRYRFGTGANPILRKTIIIGTDPEALRVASLLKRTEFLKGYRVVGCLDYSLERLHQEAAKDLPILGDIGMLGKIVKSYGIREIIFPEHSLPYAEMLGAMQRAAEENPSVALNFNVVPRATEVILGKQRIELLSGAAKEESLALVPVQYNLYRFSHRFLKRLTDIALATAAYPFVYVAAKFSGSRALLESLTMVIAGEQSLVGVTAPSRAMPLAKRGVTSLAAVTLGKLQEGREEDVKSLDLYYLRNHTVGMDFEILIRSLFGETRARKTR